MDRALLENNDRVRRFVAPLLVAVVLAGCARVPVNQQRLVSKPNMVFAEDGVFVYDSRLNLQTEPGAATTAGAQSAACTSCR